MERFGAVRPPGHPGLLHILSCGEQEKAKGGGGVLGVCEGKSKEGRMEESLSGGD